LLGQVSVNRIGDTWPTTKREKDGNAKHNNGVPERAVASPGDR
jgi:hypothetical protein